MTNNLSSSKESLNKNPTILKNIKKEKGPTISQVKAKSNINQNILSKKTFFTKLNGGGLVLNQINLKEKKIKK